MHVHTCTMQFNRLIYIMFIAEFKESNAFFYVHTRMVLVNYVVLEIELIYNVVINFHEHGTVVSVVNCTPCP